MTVPSSPNRVQPQSRVRTYRDDPEPSLDDLLEDDTLQTLMRHDRVARPELEALIDETRRKLGLGDAGAWSARRRFAAALFAECRAA